MKTDMKMKTRLLGWCCAMLGTMFLTSCEKDDDLRVSDVPGVVVDSFVSKFPDASRTEWEKKSGYVVADFWQNGLEVQAWYDSDGKWLMTEYDLGIDLSALPQAVQDALQNGQYGTWYVDDIDRFERPADEFYLIDVETKGQQDRNLYFAPDGRLLKDEVDRGDDDVRPDIVL
jgi:hypothetical protein